MGIYGKQILENYTNDAELVNVNELMEMFLVDELSRMPKEQLQEFCAPGGPADALVEANILRRKTIVRLSKADDEERRATLAAFKLAKDAKDPLWDKLVKNRVKEKELIQAIKNKYGNKAERAAKLGQKEFLKHKFKLPSSFMKAGGEDRT